MLFLFSTVLAVCLTLGLQESLKKHPAVYYWGAGTISLLLGFWDFPTVPAWLDAYVFDLFRRGTLATAIWCIVMFAGALSNGRLKKIWIPLRGNLSILAAILTLCHTIAYTRIYASSMSQNPGSMSGIRILAVHLSMLMLLIMIPLTILSFPKIRRMLSPRRWKAIQRLAYVFYGLLYVHVMILTIPSAKTGNLEAQISVLIYSLVYLSYAVLRVKSVFAVKRRSLRPDGVTI